MKRRKLKGVMEKIEGIKQKENIKVDKTFLHWSQVMCTALKAALTGCLRQLPGSAHWILSHDPFHDIPPFHGHDLQQNFIHIY